MNDQISCLTKIKTLYPEMTDSEKSIADFILNHPEEIYSLKIGNLARETGVSLPTVFRFTQTLGYNGFKDFKVDLVKDMAVGLNISMEDMDGSSLENLTRNIFKIIEKNLKETRSLIDYDALGKAIKEIIDSKKLIFFAVSSSLSVAFDSYSKFLRAGFDCLYNADSYTQRVMSTQCGTRDVAIGISFSGESMEVIDCLKNARDNGATTICITTFMKSAITEFADIKLFTAPVQSYYQKIDLPSKMSLTAILDVLYLNAVLHDRKKALEYISKSEEELNKFNKIMKSSKLI
ncbi:MurR/RpiR family transcriptional regulator [Actinomycetota bacterium]